MGIMCSRLRSFRLLHFGYPAGFGVQRPTTSVGISTGRQRNNQKQVEGGHHRNSSKIHCTMEKNDLMQLESRMEARFSTFSANRCNWISISCSDSCWTYWLFCMFRTPKNLLHYFHR